MYNYAPPTAYPTALFDTRERTANTAATETYDQLYENIRKTIDFSIKSSQVLTRNRVFNDLNEALWDLRLTKHDWNSYGSPGPSADSIGSAGAILDTLRRHNLLAERVLPSAEGGVAVTFMSNTPNRAVIEVLNEGETFLLLYNRSGDSETIDWPHSSQMQDETVARLKRHLRGTSLAAS